MLYCNDVLVPMTEDMKKEVEKELGGKWPMVIKMPDHMYTKTPANEKPDRPPFSVIPLISDCHNEESGSERWVYCTSRSKIQDKWVYSHTLMGTKQSFLQIEDRFVIQKRHIDLAYFLLFKSKMREIPGESDEKMRLRGIDPNRFRAAFVVENKEREAILKLSKREQRIKVESALLGDKGLKEKDLRVIASALYISNADSKGLFELKEEILAHVEKLERTKFRDKEGRTGYEIFIHLSKLDEITDIRATIQKCIDMKIIVEDDKETAFFYVSEKGRKTNKLTGPVGARTMIESLEHFLKENPHELATMKTLIEEKSLINA